jgi:uncharacterized RDD family membrane protein YckC
MNDNYAGFWLRFVAAIIDAIILGALQFIAVMPILGLVGIGVASEMQDFDPSNQAEAMSMAGQIMAFAGVSQFIFLAIQTLYFALMESSNYQASIGKMVLGLKVTDVNGGKLDFVKAFVRNLSKVISTFILFIGYIMAGFTEKKQALHDMIAGTLVLKK